MSYKFKPVAVVSVVVSCRGRFLIVEERLGNGLPVYNTPSGHLERWESLTEGARRELFEETGIRTESLDGIVGVYALVQDSYTMVRTVFFLELAREPELAVRDPDRDVVGHRWLTLEECRALRGSYRSDLVIDAIEDYSAGRKFPLSLLRQYDRLSAAVRAQERREDPAAGGEGK